MHSTTTGKNIYKFVIAAFKNYNLQLFNLLSIATDGSPSITGNKKRFEIQQTHCITHKGVLCAGVINMDNVFVFVKKRNSFSKM